MLTLFAVANGTFGPPAGGADALGYRVMIPEHEALPRRRSLHHLIDEANREAAVHPVGSPEHDFYAGVRAAAEDRLNPHRLDSHTEGWLSREPALFREGYAKATAVIGASGHGLAPHYHLPRPG